MRRGDSVRRVPYGAGMGYERARYLQRQFNLAEEGYEQILAAQGGVCGCCGGTEVATIRSLAVDHDHMCCPEPGRSCGRCVRGLLCGGCNGLIGMYELCQLGTLAPELLDQFNAYLRRYAAPNRAPIPGIAGRPATDRFRQGEVRIRYSRRWMAKHAHLIFVSLNNQVADYEHMIARGSGDPEQARAGIERLGRFRQRLEELVAEPIWGRFARAGSSTDGGS